MPRDIDKRKTNAALRKIRRALARLEKTENVELTDWEAEFMTSVEERLNTYGAAFHDSDKGNLDEALSYAQAHILRQIDKKARGKAKPSSFKPKRPSFQSRGRDINDDLIHDEAPQEEQRVKEDIGSVISERKSPVQTEPLEKARKGRSSPLLRVIEGGKS